MGTTPIGANGLTTITGISLVQLVADYESSMMAADAALSQIKQQITDGNSSTLTAANDYADERDAAYRDVDRALWRSEDQTILQAAKDDATTRFGGLPSRVTNIEGRELPDRGRLSPTTAKPTVNDITTNGKYQVWSSTDAVNLSMPTANGGELEVYSYGDVVHQRYWVLESSWQFYIRRKSGTTWSAWEAPLKTAVTSGRWEKAGSLATTTNLNTLGSGIYHVYSSTGATELGLPVAAGGILEVVFVTDSAALQTYRSFGAPQQNWQRERTSSVWTPWRRLDAPVESAEDGPGSGFKVVPLAVTLPATGSKYSFTARTERHMMTWNAPVTRWRAHIRNFDYRLNQSLPGSVAFTGLWFGEHDTAGGLNGAYKAAPVQVAGAKTVADGAEWLTSWINYPIEAGKEYLLSYGYTAATGQEFFLQVGNVFASNSSTAAGTQAAPGGTGGALLDVWIEAETYATTPVVAALGDSLSSGVGATYGVRDSWLSQYCEPRKMLPVHYAASGDSYGGWTNPAWEKWTRWQNLAHPDALVAALGSNDIFQGVTLAQLQTWFEQVITGLKDVVTPNVYLATIMPRTNATGATETVRRDFNTWLRTLPQGARDIFDFAAAISNDDETIRPEYDDDGVHLNTAGYAAVAGAVARPVTAPAVVYAV